MKIYNYNKYNNTKVEIDGIMFASKKEGNRYLELKLLEKVGEITGLYLQPKYSLIPSNDKYREIFYRADFEYCENGKKIVEDVKGFKKDKVYILKKKLMYSIHKISIKEV